MKPKDEVIQEFNLQNNMTVDELQAWLDNPQSKTAGTGVGVDSGHKIVEILKKNPSKDPELYDDEDIGHMRKVVGYNKRHMAQEDHLKETKSKEELEKTKSTISMKNWGHDPVKTLDEEESGKDADDEKEDKDVKESAESEVEKDDSAPAEETIDEPQEEEVPGVGSKRKLGESTQDENTDTVETSEAVDNKDRTGSDVNEAAKEKAEASEERARKKSKTTDGEVPETDETEDK